jgi:hypothetical protein
MQRDNLKLKFLLALFYSLVMTKALGGGPQNHRLVLFPRILNQLRFLSQGGFFIWKILYN